MVLSQSELYYINDSGFNVLFTIRSRFANDILGRPFQGAFDLLEDPSPLQVGFAIAKALKVVPHAFLPKPITTAFIKTSCDFTTSHINAANCEVFGVYEKSSSIVPKPNEPSRLN